MARSNMDIKWLSKKESSVTLLLILVNKWNDLHFMFLGSTRITYSFLGVWNLFFVPIM